MSARAPLTAQKSEESLVCIVGQTTHTKYCLFVWKLLAIFQSRRAHVRFLPGTLPLLHIVSDKNSGREVLSRVSGKDQLQNSEATT